MTLTSAGMTSSLRNLLVYFHISTTLLSFCTISNYDRKLIIFCTMVNEIRSILQSTFIRENPIGQHFRGHVA